MRSTFYLAAALTAAPCLAAIAAAQKATTGNGAPSGSHYNLNIIGVPHAKNPNMDQGSGNVIFVGLGSNDTKANTRILLSQTFDGSFGVLDKNGTDGTASFELPAPGGYQVYARALGKPGGRSEMTTCATDPTTGELICSTLSKVFVRGTGKSKFDNVTTELTTITLPADIVCLAGPRGGTTLPAGTVVSLFDPCLQGYLWDYDNYGLKLLQIRFYPD